MKWNNRKKKNYSISVPHFYCIEYCEGKKKMIIEMDFREPFFELGKDIIKHWEPPYQDENIDDDTKRKILLNICEYLLVERKFSKQIIIDDLDE